MTGATTDLHARHKRLLEQQVALAALTQSPVLKPWRPVTPWSPTTPNADPRTCEFSISYLAPLGITAMMDMPIHV